MSRPLPTHVRGNDGTPIQSYARERRVELSFNEYPPLLVRAFLAAEDKSFFEHGGVDYPGLAGAVLDYAKKWGTGRRARGGSTITQQVAKNLLIGDAYSPTRKVKEAILAYKIEDTLTKQQILELYLNQIALGRNAFGVEAAAHAYFDKELNELTLGQMAYLALLPKGPANYDPIRHPDRALERRPMCCARCWRTISSPARNMMRRWPSRWARCCAARRNMRRSAAISSRSCAAS